MSKAFTKESDGDDEDDLPEDVGGLPAGAKNYMTPQGFERMREELMTLMRKERPEVVQVVSWAAANGDRMYARRDGYYIAGASVLVQPFAAGRLMLTVRHNNDGILAYNSLGEPSNESGETLSVVAGMFWMDADEYVYVEAYQSSGGDRDITAAGASSSGYNCGWLMRVV